MVMVRRCIGGERGDGDEVCGGGGGVNGGGLMVV